MEDFTARTYGTSGQDNRPLFGETSAKVSAGVGPGPACAWPASLHPAGACSGPGVDLEVERAGPAIPPPSRDVCPALVLSPRAGWSGAESSESSGQLVGSPSRECGNPTVEGDSWAGCTTALWSRASGVRLELPPRA